MHAGKIHPRRQSAVIILYLLYMLICPYISHLYSIQMLEI